MQDQTGDGDGLRQDLDGFKDRVGEGEKNLSILEVSIVGVQERFRTDVERLRTDIAKLGEENTRNANARDWRLIIFMFVLVSIATSIILTVLGN